MSDLFRFNSAAPPPPPAPPLPPQRYANRATNAIARFAQPFIYGSRPPSAQANRPEQLSGRTGISIAALDISPQRTHVILAGREILKTVRVENANCAEEFNLRSAIIAYASTHNTSNGAVSAKHKDQLAATDVKWSKGGQFDSTIATAAANGKIVLYDINRSGVELARLHEHNRQVHKVAFNPHHGALLLSGSQDTTVKLWDLRELSGGRSFMNCRSIRKYYGNSDGVRDVKWSPTDGVEFAFCTDNGVIERWDMRKENAPLLKVNAHSKPCRSIDWHPDGKHLVSAGADKQVKVWDFSSSNRRQKSTWEFRAPQCVMNVRWRPPCWSAETHGPGAWQCTHLVTSYDQKDPRIHLWDFRRPHIPFREFDRYNSSPTDLLWHSEDLLWTVGHEGMFTQTDIHFAPKVLERRSLQSFDWAPDGSMTFFSQKRPHRRGSLMEVQTNGINSGSRSKESSGENLGSSRSATDDSIDESFLSSSFKRRHERTPSAKSMKSLASTPPSSSINQPVKDFEDALDKSSALQPKQLGATGETSSTFMSTFNRDVFAYLARNSLTTHPIYESKLPVVDNLIEDLYSIFASNAMCAESVGLYRRSQSWKMLGQVFMRELQSRANENRRLRLKQGARSAAESGRQKDNVRQMRKIGKDVESPKLHSATEVIPGSESRYLRAGFESSSNMTTPMARPLPDSFYSSAGHPELPDFEAADKLTLPSGILSSNFEDENTGPENVVPQSSILSKLDRLSATQWYNNSPEVIQRRAFMNGWKAQPKPILSLDPLREQSNHGRSSLSLERQDSAESFTMFSASTDSSHRARSLGSSFSGSQKSQGSDLVPERWDEKYAVKNLSLRSNDFSAASADVNTSSSEYVDYSTGENLQSPTPAARPPKTGASSIIVSEDNPKILLSTPDPNSAQQGVDRVPKNDITRTIPKPRQSEARTFSFTSSGITDAKVSTHSYIEYDFLPNASPVEVHHPWNTVDMLTQLLDFHTETLADVQTPSLLIILLSPFLPSNSISYHLAEGILSTYHTQLANLSLHIFAASLRLRCTPTYPAIFDIGLEDIYLSLLCKKCRKPIENIKSKSSAWICERCLSTQAPCSVCRLALPAGSELWAWCQGCGHGGHDSCLLEWWDEDWSQGGCPLEGCLHDCVKGTRRQERLRELDRRKPKGLAKRDSWVVGESKAVEKVRGALGGANVPSSERRVRLKAPTEEERADRLKSHFARC
ncbi:MAG: SEA (Seh1-associated) complex subunit [Pycnora praestabilis]|nr:MAG: SEA (Seh1-associated) complex subunit [Pycnora praestabilis]